jgi:signal transduction histidine kinase
MNAPARRQLLRTLVIGLMVAIVTLLHYGTPFHVHAAHGIYRRLYYFPILFAAFWGGWPAALATSLVVCAVYLPHALGWVGFDPAPTLEKALEMVLYVAIGIVAGVLVSRRNRTEREKAAMEEELVRAARLAAVGRLSAGLAHEIRNPLASIQGAAEVLQDDFPAAHPKGKLLRVLTEEAARLNTVLTRFLAFARPQPGRREPVDLVVEARRAVELAAHREGAPRLQGPAQGAGPCLVRGDREQLGQVLLNVILNAAQAAGPDGNVTVGVSRDGGRAVCAVEDDGPGFTSEALESLGTPFFTTKPGGTGLGLAICHRILEDHGGGLSAVNRPDGGARVRIELPAADDGAGT